jgi:hypothetical protein
MKSLVTRAQLAAVVALACLSLAGKLDRLSDAEYDHYRALRVFMEEPDRKAWLKLDTAEERDAWLKEAGLWDKYYSLPEELRAKVINGEVGVGFTREMVYMAWGAPFQKQRLTGRDAARSELLVYRFEIDKDGVATPLVGKRTDYKAVGQHQTEVYMDDDRVTEMVERDQWQ